MPQARNAENSIPLPLRKVFDSLRYGISLTDAGGVTLLENARFHTLWGQLCETDDLRAKSPLVKDPHKFLKGIASLAKARKRSTLEVELKDGRHLECTCEPFAAAGVQGLRLWQVSDITERALALEKLESESRRGRRLEAIVRGVDERERERLGREIHDMVGQTLSVLSMRCEVLKNRLVIEGSKHALDASSILDSIKVLMNQTRSLARQLFPVAVESRTIDEPLMELAGSLRVSLGIRCSCRIKGQEHLRRLNAEQKINLFRIAQEAVGNAVKHGKAGNIRITLSLTAESGVLMVSNDGRTMSGDGNGDGIGMAIMKSRAKLLGGALSISKQAKGGVRLKCSFPFAASEERRRKSP